MSKGSLRCLAISAALSICSYPVDVDARVSSHQFHNEADADAKTWNQSSSSRQLASARKYRLFKDRTVGDSEDSTQQDHEANISESEAKVLGQWFIDQISDERLGDGFKDVLSVDYADQPVTTGVVGGDGDEENTEDVVIQVEAAEDDQINEADKDDQFNEVIEEEDDEDGILYNDPDCKEPRGSGVFKKRNLVHRRNLGSKGSKSAYAYQLFHAQIQPSTEYPVPTSTMPPIAITHPADDDDEPNVYYYYYVADDDFGGKSQKGSKNSYIVYEPYYTAKSAKAKSGKGSKSGDFSTEIPMATGKPSVRCTKSPTLTPTFIIETYPPSEIVITQAPSSTGISLEPTGDGKVTASPVAAGTLPTGSPVAVPVVPTTASPTMPISGTARPTTLSPISSSPAGTLLPSSSIPVLTLSPVSLAPATSSPAGGTFLPTTLVSATPTTIVPSTPSPSSINVSLPPGSVPPVGGTASPVSLPPAVPSVAPVTLPPGTAAPVTLPPVSGTAAPVTLPPGTAAPVTLPPVSGTAAPVTLPPGTAAPVTTLPPVSGTVAPVSLPPAIGTTAPVTLAPVIGTVAPATLSPATLPPSASTSPSSLTLGTLPPTTALLGPTTIAPTSVPVDATYYRGFEQGNFPFVVESTDPVWTTENAIDSTLVWSLSNERANTGVFSIKSPVLENDAATPGTANATLTMPDLGPGTLYFSVFASVQIPIDGLAWFVDGQLREGVQESMTAFQQKSIIVEPGAHVFSFMYVYNPEALPVENLPPSGTFPSRTGSVFIDDVYFIPLAL